MDTESKYLAEITSVMYTSHPDTHTDAGRNPGSVYLYSVASPRAKVTFVLTFIPGGKRIWQR